LKAIWYNKFTFDYLSIVCITIWTILMPLKLDNIIDWSWHYIYFPWYVFLVHFLLGIIAFDLISLFLSDDGYRTLSGKQVGKGYNFMRLFAMSQFFRGIVYFTAATFLSFFILIAEYHQTHSFPEQIVWIPIWLFIIAWFIAIVTGCGLYKFRNCCRDKERLLLVLPIGYFIWAFVFIWLKATDLTTMAWEVVLIPFWIIFGSGFIVSIIGMLYLCCGGGREKFPLGLLSVSFMIMLPSFLALLTMVCENLNNQLLQGEIVRPWVLVFIPIYVVQIVFFIACGLMTKALNM